MSEQTNVSKQDLASLESFAQQSAQQATESEVIEAVPSIVQRGGVYLISAGLVITLLLLFFGKAHNVVTATGHIIPEGESIPVQSIDGGVVTEILARPGDRVSEGSPILRVDRAQSGLSVATLSRDLQLLQRKLASLRSDSTAVDRLLASPTSAMRSAASLETADVLQIVGRLRSALLAFNSATESRTTGLADKQGQLEREIDLSEHKISVLEENVTAARQEVERTQTRLADFRKLADSGTISVIELEQHEERAQRSKERLSQLELDLANERLRLSDLNVQRRTSSEDAESEYEAARTEYEGALAALRQKALDLDAQLRETESGIQTKSDELEIARSKLRFGSVTAPVAGTVANLEVTASGEIVAAGSVVAVIVPDGAPLVVRASIPGKDVGFVEEGMATRVKVDAFPFQQFGTVAGEIRNVFPNTGEEDNFTVIIGLEHEHVGNAEDPISLFPGLGVTAEILTGKQRLLQLVMGK